MDVWRGILVSLCLLIGGPLCVAASGQQIICYGDSITAGHGLNAGQAYPEALKRLLDQHGYHYSVRNMGTSGATSKDAAANIVGVLKPHPNIVIVEFGGNDGLRGLPLEQTRKNLDAVLTALDEAHTKVLLAGITLPPNYGADYVDAFDKVFRDLAKKHHTAFVPMIYKDLINVPGTIQDDGIHPTAKGSEIIATTLLPALKPFLHK